jgi:hypothetical protein
MRQAAQDMKAAITLVRTSAEQRRRLWQYAGGGALAGLLLWSFLPGTIARAVPEKWYWPERTAARMIGEPSRWDAGARLIQAVDLLRDNQDAIDACRKSAATSRQPARCTVRIPAGSEPSK